MWDFMAINIGIILLIIIIICVVAIIAVKLYYRKNPEEDVDVNLFGSHKFFSDKTKEDTDKIIEENDRIMYQNMDRDEYYDYEYNDMNRRNIQPNYNPNIRQNQPNPQYIANNPYNANPIIEGDNMSPDNFGKIEKKEIAKKIENQENKEIIMTDQSTKKETYAEIKEKQPAGKEQELKVLFTIDELIKESKRKNIPNTNSESQPAAPQTTEPKKEVPKFLTPEERESMKDNVEEMEQELDKKSTEREIGSNVNPVEKQTDNGVYKHTQSPINSPILKSPTKTENLDSVVKESVQQKIDEQPIPVDQSTKKETYANIAESHGVTQDQPIKENLFEEASTVNIDNVQNEDEEEYDDLDYRKDIARITNKVKNSKIFNDVKNKLKIEEEEDVNPSVDEEFLRNVRSYDSPEPIEPIKEYDDFESPYIEPEHVVKEEPKIEKAKEIHIQPPKKQVVDLRINNNPAKLKKGDEIIFKYNGDTYSSRVLNIDGDDISVKFRGQFITIKPSDVKKIF